MPRKRSEFRKIGTRDQSGMTRRETRQYLGKSIGKVGCHRDLVVARLRQGRVDRDECGGDFTDYGQPPLAQPLARGPGKRIEALAQQTRQVEPGIGAELVLELPHFPLLPQDQH